MLMKVTYLQNHSMQNHEIQQNLKHDVIGMNKYKE